MNLYEYQNLAMRTAGDTLGDQVHGLVVTALGLSGEALELGECLWEHEYWKQDAVKELGDCCWYVARGCAALGVEMGPISAMTDLNLGASTSIDLLGMWFRDDGPAASHEEAVQDMFFRLAGPLGGYVGNVAKGVQDFQNGQGDRGLEKMVPAFFRGPLAASRLAREGNLTPDGAEVANAEFYTMGKLVAQSGGFASTSVAELQKTNIMAKRMIKKIEKEKADLLGKLDRAFQRGDEAKIDALFTEIEEYNERNYVLPITGATIRNSLSGRMESRGSALNGLVVSPRMQGIMAAQLGNRDINPEEG